MQKNYYAIIPANVRYDKNLTPNSKLLYGEITALCNEKGYCWANNQYFAELYGVSKKSVSTWISDLIEGGYIKSEIQYKEGTKEIFHRYLRIVHYPMEENVNTPMEEKVKDNITDINTTFNNTKDIYIPYSEIVDYLNKKASTNYRSSAKATQRLIKARWNEGFRLDDFKKVIDNKVADANDPKDFFQAKYLRPETLFGTKFESYLNQKGGGQNRTNQDTAKVSEEYDFGF